MHSGTARSTCGVFRDWAIPRPDRLRQSCGIAENATLATMRRATDEAFSGRHAEYPHRRRQTRGPVFQRPPTGAALLPCDGLLHRGPADMLPRRRFGANGRIPTMARAPVASPRVSKPKTEATRMPLSCLQTACGSDPQSRAPCEHTPACLWRHPRTPALFRQ